MRAVGSAPYHACDFFVQWECFVTGPTDTPYEGGLFRAIIQFPTDYPLSPVRLALRIWSCVTWNRFDFLSPPPPYRAAQDEIHLLPLASKHLRRGPGKTEWG